MAPRGLVAAVVWVSLNPVGQSQTPPPGPPVFNPEILEYIVEPGDTLWAVAERVVGNPFLWPKVWAYNPEITNPHWIYPGDFIRFYPPDMALPFSQEQPLTVARSELAVPEVIEGARARADEVQEVEVVGAPPGARPRPRPAVFVGLFVTEQELAEAGVISNAREDKILLSTGDQVYGRFPRNEPPSVGDTFLVFRTARRIVHPETQANFGYVTQVTGLARVEAWEPPVARLRLGVAQAEIERGQRLLPMTRDPRFPIARKPAEKALNGHVVAVREYVATIAGQRQVVFVDLGAEAGLEIGNELRVFHRGDAFLDDTSLPYYPIGTLLVVDVQAKGATCVVLESRREIEPGNRVQTVVSLRRSSPRASR